MREKLKNILYILLGATILVTVGVKSCFSDVFSCGDESPIGIVAPDDSMNEYVCNASGKALDFLSQYGLYLDQPVSIMIVEDAINSHGYVAFGSYNRQSDMITMMSFPAIMNSGSPEMYGQPFDLEHYLGAVAHEVAHAVFHHNSSKVEDQKTNSTQEYLAHATQLGVLSPERRRRIIDAHDVGPWESGDSISEIYMALNPTGFAVKSFLHLTQLEDPKPFINILLNHNWFYVSVP